MKKIVKLTKEDLSSIVKESIIKIINENKEPEITYNIKDYHPNENEWTEYIKPNKRKIWEFLDNGYKKAGLGRFRGCDNDRTLFKNANLIRIAYCNNMWVAISVYTGYRGGFKCVGITATTDELFRKVGVSAVHDIIKKDIGLFEDFYWTECSGKIAELYEKYNGIKIPFEFAEQMVSPVITKVDDFYFRRLEVNADTDDNKECPLKIVYGFNSKETFDAVYNKYNEYIDSAIEVIKNRKINEEVEVPSFGRYSNIDYAENIINIFVDIRWSDGIYEFPEEKLVILKSNVDYLVSILSTGKCPNNKIQRIQQAIENGNDILCTSTPMRLNKLF